LKQITYFRENQIKGISLPEKFTFPFFYEPHELTKIAASELQHYLEHHFDKEHNFGLDATQDGLVIGKMFGVLVVQDREGRLGYLSAFSGKLAGTNAHEIFVPPVFDMLQENSFFLREAEFVNEINRKIELIEANQHYILLKNKLETYITQSKQELANLQLVLKENKASRKKLRLENNNVLSEDDYLVFEADLIKQSLRDKHLFNVLSKEWSDKIASVKEQLDVFEAEIEQLKTDRKEKSSALQKQLFEQYAFLNQYGKSKSLGAIFSETVFGKPPAAAGECATPKLLQYAFLNALKPIAMAEFWWGASPKSEVRKHKQFYPACTGKCEPILKHMLEGIVTDENPFLKNFGEGKQLEIIYEDDSFVVVNKPFDLLSVPGINVQDSVYTRLKIMLKSEPLIIHRLDMPTSGLLVVAKTKEVHKHIQKQFLNRKVNKRYTALLSREIEQQQGEINLPLRMNIEDRPRQMVCFEFGKKAVTKFEVIEKKNGKTKIHFYPLTGRTHQLRMHSAHELGLNAPIVGDDLYGNTADRLYLHAAFLEFTHPISNQRMTFEVPEDF
jgi:tRNA pseudouridine32 synthase/23S rRNA pseudouridine746 synthase